MRASIRESEQGSRFAGDDLKKTKHYLDYLLRSHDARYVATDPLTWLHKCQTDADREAVGFIASAFAYGNVKAINRSVGWILERMEASASSYLACFSPNDAWLRFEGFRHRFNDRRDLVCLLHIMAQMVDRWGSMGRFFQQFYCSTDDDLGPALARFVDAALELDTAGMYGPGPLPQAAGVRFFFPSPTGGSACKRLNLFLRWMVRERDGIDWGLWPDVPPSKLIIPLDTHVARIARYIGLTSYSSPGWTMALDITQTLRYFDPADPVKYDFALSRLGILDLCPRRRDSTKCNTCHLLPVCTQ